MEDKSQSRHYFKLWVLCQRAFNENLVSDNRPVIREMFWLETVIRLGNAGGCRAGEPGSNSGTGDSFSLKFNISIGVRQHGD